MTRPRPAIPPPSPPGRSPDGKVDQDLVRRLREQVVDRLAAHAAARDADRGLPTHPAQRRDLAERLLTEALDGHARGLLGAGKPLLDPAAEAAVARAVRDQLLGLGGFQRLLEDPEIENINANGCDVVWVRYADGRRERVAPVADSDDDLIELIRTVAARAGVQERRFDRGCPRLSVQLPDGSRLFAVMAVTKRPCVAIRRHRYLRVTLDGLVDLGTIDDGLRQFLSACVLARKNIVVSGGPSVGKTTFLRALASAIPPDERLVTIEDSYELALDEDPGHWDVVAKQVREPNVEGEGAVDLPELVRWALRMSPERVIVGEVRGGEAVPMLLAMSQGCDGSMTTVHASTTRSAFGRLATYAAQSAERLSMEAATMLIGNAVHFVVQLDYATDGPRRRDGARGTRVVSSVRQVVDTDGVQVISNEVYRPGPDKRAQPQPGALSTEVLDDLVAAGMDPGALHTGGWSR